MRNIDFVIPNKLSQKGMFIIFCTNFYNIARSFLAIFFVMMLKYALSQILYFLIPLLVITIIVFLFSYLNYQRTFFQLESQNTFVYETGVFHKQRVTIPLDKIQQISITQGLIQKIFRVYKLTVDSGGSSKVDVKLPALDLEIAEALKAALLQTEVLPKSEIQNSDIKSFYSLRFSTLLKLGFTADYRATFVFLFLLIQTLYENTKNLLSYNEKDWIENGVQKYQSSFFYLYLFAFAFLTFILINIIRVFLKYANYKIEKNNHKLSLSYGLINTNSEHIQSNRIQIFEWEQNYFQKLFDIAIVKIHQLEQIDEVSKKGKKGLHIPGVSTAEFSKIKELLQIKSAAPIAVLKPHIKFYFFKVFIFGFLPALLLLSFAFYFNYVQIAINIALPYILLNGIFWWVYYKNHRLIINEDFIQVKQGVWDKSTLYIDLWKIQYIELSQLFWQVKHNLGSIKVRTAGGSLYFSTTEFDKLQDLTNNWIYNIESSPKDWM